MGQMLPRSKIEAKDSFQIYVASEQKSGLEKGKRPGALWGTRSRLEVFYGERGRLGRVEFCGQYNKLKLSQNKHPCPTEDGRGSQTLVYSVTVSQAWCSVAK